MRKRRQKCPDFSGNIGAKIEFPIGMSTALSRRDFIRNAAILSGAAGASGLIPASIARALSIAPEPGSTFHDAEHVVILMQENRSFDHVYGMLSGVRGFDDPRVMSLADGNPSWFQTEKAGNTFGPWWLDIHGSRSTWTSCLPHGRGDQIAAAANGRHDGWLDAKRSYVKQLSLAPLTMGHYDRRDIPFYYAMADAFTVFDENYSSICTSTYPNRAFLWSGTNRDLKRPERKVVVSNNQFCHTARTSWKSFPETLEDHGVDWKMYVNEIDLPTGMTEQENYWLGSFTCNVLEYFEQYRTEYHPRRRAFREKEIPRLAKKIANSKAPVNDRQKKALAKLRQELALLEAEHAYATAENFAKLPEREKTLHRKGMVTNENDPQFRKLAKITYENSKGKTVTDDVPAGDVLYQFRKDVNEGKLPTVSWLVAPEAFSDHPSSAWFGAWYLSEVFDILTKNPEVWKKTVFILTYDENDGYFDHMPPHTPPKPGDSATGSASEGVDTTQDFDDAGNPCGLGFRVPLVIASPWTRGGRVCSQITDHTSVIRFIEEFVSQKTGRPLVEPNISPWRRTVCGDLTPAFLPGARNGDNPKPLERDAFVRSIYGAQDKPDPSGYKKLGAEELAGARADLRKSGLLPRQEKGGRESVALPYELYSDAIADRATGKVRVSLGAGNTGKKSCGAPFRVFAPGKYQGAANGSRTYAVKAGDSLSGEWDISGFEGGAYFLRVHGPNGFWREFRGAANDPALRVTVSPHGTGNLVVRLENTGDAPLTVTVADVSYGAAPRRFELKAKGSDVAALALESSHHWYDLAVTVEGSAGYVRRYAGRVETGKTGRTDPLIGAV